MKLFSKNLKTVNRQVIAPYHPSRPLTTPYHPLLRRTSLPPLTTPYHPYHPLPSLTTPPFHHPTATRTATRTANSITNGQIIEDQAEFAPPKPSVQREPTKNEKARQYAAQVRHQPYPHRTLAREE